MATWAKGLDFKNSGNTARIGGVGMYGTDTASEKIYIGFGTEPWNNAGLQVTKTAINYKGNKIYHAGDKPTLSELGAAAASHTHSYLPLSGGTLTGRLTMNTAGAIFPTTGGSWIAGKTTTNVIQFTNSNSGNYHPFIRYNVHNGNVSNIGAIDNKIGFWGFLSATTANQTDAHAYLDIGNGAFYAKTFAGALNGNATTATTLQTARTINGTSFNGSANITTANWGTARNITIGNTAKSINGSANVSWSLSEIGAAAASHSHSYLPLSGGTVTGETVFNNYLSINAWPNYGSGKAQLWYNGTNKQLVIQPTAVTDILVNNNLVYHQGRKPTASEIGAASSSHGHSNYVGGSGEHGTTTVSNANTIWKSGFYDNGGSGSNYPVSNQWCWLIHSGHVSNYSTYRYGLQISGVNASSGFYMRTVNQSGEGTWRELWHSGNFDPNSKVSSETLRSVWSWNDLNWRLENHHGFCSFDTNESSGASPFYPYGAGISFGGPNCTAQFYIPEPAAGGRHLYFRGQWANKTANNTWNEIWHSGNFAPHHWGTGNPSNSDGKPDGTVYYKYA